MYFIPLQKGNDVTTVLIAIIVSWQNATYIIQFILTIYINSKKLMLPGRFGWLVVLRLNVPVNNFSVILGRSHRFLGN